MSDLSLLFGVGLQSVKKIQLVQFISFSPDLHDAFLSVLLWVVWKLVINRVKYSRETNRPQISCLCVLTILVGGPMENGRFHSHEFHGFWQLEHALHTAAQAHLSPTGSGLGLPHGRYNPNVALPEGGVLCVSLHLGWFVLILSLGVQSIFRMRPFKSHTPDRLKVVFPHF
jgi:hypothetical protein